MTRALCTVATVALIFLLGFGIGGAAHLLFNLLGVK